MKNGAFEFRGDPIPPGVRRQFDIPVSRLPSGTELSLSVTVLNGSGRGPVVWLSGALHGDEIVGVEIIHQTLQQIDVKRFAGTLIATPVVNVFGFVAESRYLPDRRDLNRSFPGSRTGSLAARLANLFMTEVVARCDVGIDFHAGSNDRTNLPQIRANLDDPETLRLARAFGAPLVIHSKPPKGTLRAAALRRGKRILLFEGGEPRRFSAEAIEAGVPGTLRVLAALEMIDSGPAPEAIETLESRKTVWVRAARGGVFRLRTSLGDTVKKGDVLGIISDPVAGAGTPVRARTDGRVLGHTVDPLVHQGDALVHLAVILAG